MTRKAKSPLKAIEHVDREEPPAFILSEDERRIVEECREHGFSYRYIRGYLDQARRDRIVAGYDADEPSLVALTAFRHKLGNLIESAMDYNGDGRVISYCQVEHQMRGLWVWRLQGEIDSEQFNVEVHLRMDEFS